MISRPSAALAIMLAALGACDQQPDFGNDARANRQRPLVCTTIHPLQFFVQRLAGDLVDCEVILPDNADPQHWVPSRKQLAHLLDADLVIFHGATLEAWRDQVGLPRSRRSVVCTGFDPHFLKIEGAITHTHGGKAHTHDGIDPFLWLDLELAGQQAEVVARALGRLLPAQQQEIGRKLAPLQQELSAARVAHKTSLGPIRAVYATTRLFDYWARSHQVEVTNLDLHGAPDTTELTKLREVVSKTDARLVLCPQDLSTGVAEALRGLGLTPVVFDPCFVAAKGTDFLQVMAQNHARLQAALNKEK